MSKVVPFTPFQVLLVEDVGTDAELIRMQLEEEGEDVFYAMHAVTLSEGVATLNEQPFQLVLLDISLPDADGLDGLKAIQAVAPSLPVVMLTGHDDEALALAAVEGGAQDYLIKGKFDAVGLKRAARYAIQRKQFEEGIIRQANYDQLTGLANRLLFESRLEMALARVRRTGQGVGTFFLDLNSFKDINDQFGHGQGDRLLKEVAYRLSKCIRPYDTAARFGGDEFALLVEGIGKGRDCVAVAQKVIERIAEPFSLGGREVQVGVSIGIATSMSGKDASAELLIRQADEAMYRSKCSPASTYHFYTTEMEDEARARLQLETDLTAAVRQGELTLCYQPVQALISGDTCGLEALVRWKHPERGILLPGEFMAVAEETGMVAEIGDWVLAEVCRDMARWKKLELPMVQVSVNIAPSQLDAPDFADSVEALLDKHKLSAACLALEVPETAFLPRLESREAALSQLRETGVSICLDRFGTGTASLYALKSALFNLLKLDAKLTQGMQENAEYILLVKAIIDVAHQLGLKVGALNVESAWQRDCLKDQLCDSAQGFVFSKPMPAPFLEEWLKQHRSVPPLEMAADQPLPYITRRLREG